MIYLVTVMMIAAVLAIITIAKIGNFLGRELFHLLNWMDKPVHYVVQTTKVFDVTDTFRISNYMLEDMQGNPKLIESCCHDAAKRMGVKLLKDGLIKIDKRVEGRGTWDEVTVFELRIKVVEK